MRKFNINVDGNNYVVEVEEVGASATQAPVVTSITPAKAAPKAAPKAVGTGVPFNSPMPGLVKALKVAEGATVKKGDVVLVLEAMKMENDIMAQADGKISFPVAAGANVNSGDVLFTIA